MVRDKGSGSIYQRASDGCWVGSLELPPGPDGARRRKVIVRKRKADLIAALTEARKDLLRTGDLATASPTMQQWLTLWLTSVASKRLKPRTFDDYRSVVDQYLIPAIGRVRLDKLTPAHVQRMHHWMTTDKGLSTTTALKAHRILAKALTDAEREGRVGRNVATLVDAPRKAVSDRVALTSREAAQLLRHVWDDRYLSAQWSLALLTGLRQGERLGLTSEALDLDAGMLTVSWQLQRLSWSHGCGKRAGKGWPCGRTRGGNCPKRDVSIPAGQEARHVEGPYWLTRPKSKRGWRQVPLAPAVVDALTRYTDMVSPGPEGLIFTRDSSPVDPAADSRSWRATCEAASVRSVPLHSARHTTATLLFELGVPEQTRVAILGHSSATVTAGYTHVATTETRRAMDRLGGLLALD